jgi:hypothetical protein
MFLPFVSMPADFVAGGGQEGWADKEEACLRYFI